MMRPTPEQVRAAVEKRKAEELAKHLEQRLAFDALFSQWLRNRSAYGDPTESEKFEVDAYGYAHGDRENELARLVTTTPAACPFHVFWKLEVLEHYLCGDGEGTKWTDSRELVMLAGIKADLIRFGIGREAGE